MKKRYCARYFVSYETFETVCRWRKLRRQTRKQGELARRAKRTCRRQKRLLVRRDVEEIKSRMQLAYIWSNISSMRRSVSSPDETPRKKLKIQRAAEYYWRTSRCCIWWWNAVSNAWYYFTNKINLGGEIKDAKMSSFSCDFQSLINH